MTPDPRSRSMRSLWPAAVLGFWACSSTTEVPPPDNETCRFLGNVERDGPPTPAAPDNTCVVVGSINPLSGPLGPVGFALENAARLAVRDVNTAGGIAGKKLCLVACDDRTDPTTDQQIAVDLITTFGAVAINGAAASASTLEAAKAAVPRGVALVSCCSTSARLSDDPNVFRSVPSDALQGVVLANVARTLPQPAERVAVIYVNDAYGESLRNVFQQAFGDLSGTVLRSVSYQAGDAQYLDVVQSALQDDPSHVVLIAFPADGAQIMRDWRDSGLAPRTKWLATDGLRDDTFVQGAAGLAEGVIGTAPLLRGAHYAGFETRYKNAFGGELPGIFNSNQYDAMILIALGIARAGPGATPGVIRDAIREVSTGPMGGVTVSADNLRDAITAAQAGDVDYSGVSGEVDIDARGDVISDYAVWEVRGERLTDRAECWSCQQEMMVSCSRRGC